LESFYAIYAVSFHKLNYIVYNSKKLLKLLSILSKTSYERIAIDNLKLIKHGGLINYGVIVINYESKNASAAKKFWSYSMQ